MQYTWQHSPGFAGADLRSCLCATGGDLIRQRVHCYPQNGYRAGFWTKWRNVLRLLVATRHHRCSSAHACSYLVLWRLCRGYSTIFSEGTEQCDLMLLHLYTFLAIYHCGLRGAFLKQRWAIVVTSSARSAHHHLHFHATSWRTGPWEGGPCQLCLFIACLAQTPALHTPAAHYACTCLLPLPMEVSALLLPHVEESSTTLVTPWHCCCTLRHTPLPAALLRCSVVVLPHMDGEPRGALR